MSTTVGFIGLGNIGSRMAKRVSQCGFSVRGYDIRPGRAEALELTPASSVAEVCQEDVVLLSLPDSAIIEQVVLGPGGILGSAREGLVVVDLSTAYPGSTRKLHALLKEKGVDLLDAGVSGGVRNAATGTLTIMVGGSAEVLERTRPVLAAIGNNIIHMGGSGAGHATKGLNNFLNAISLAATSEAMVVAKKAGLDTSLLLQVLSTSSGRSYATEVRFPRILKGDYMEGGVTHTLLAKDVDVYNSLAREVKAPTLLGGTVGTLLSMAIAMGHGDEVSNRIADVLGDLAGGVRVQPESTE